MDIQKLQDILKVQINDSNLYLTALTHRSYLNEHPEYKNPSNERLEFLGDAVLQLLSSEYLYSKYPNSKEGDLTNYRASVVNTTSLAEEAGRLNFGELLLLSNGEEVTGGRTREYILANTFEAILGAMFLDTNLDVCKDFLTRELLYKVEEIINNNGYKDSKSLFQELAQEKLNHTPVYNVLDSWGADHERTFKVGVFINEELYGTGEGSSKQRAEQAAAQSGLDKLQSV